MEEIKVGEYGRTTDGIIGIKVEYDNGIKLKIDEYSYWKPSPDSIVKHSPKLIDLIEVGDYVNGERVIETHNRANDDGEKVILTENYSAWTDDGVVSNKQIKTILTKQQYTANCYEVK